MSTTVEQLMVEVRADIRQAVSQLNALDNRTARSANSGAKLAKRMAGAFSGAAVVGGLVKVAKLSMDFDLTMRQVGVQTDQTGGKLKGLSDLALKMGADTIYSAQEAGSAMLELAKGGLTSAQIKSGALQQALTLAAAGGLELADAGSAIVNGMGAFGLSAKEAVRVTTSLAGAANASSADVSDLTQSLAAVGAGANAAGLTIEETTAALALFANQGVKGSDAGTSLKTMLARMVPTTLKASNAMEKYGLNFVKRNGDFKNLSQVAGILRKGLGKLSDSERTLALNTIFGSDASRAALFLMKSGSDGVKKYVKETKNQESAQKMANAAMEGASGAWQNFTGTMETAAITLGQKALPMITDVLTWGSDMVNEAGTWGPEVKESFGWMQEGAEDLFGVMKTGAEVVGDLAGFFTGLPGPVKEIGVQAALAALILPRLTAGVTSVTTSVGLNIARLRQWQAEMSYAATRTQATAAAMGRLGSAARGAAGIGGLVLLTQASQATSDSMKVMGTMAGGALLGFSVGGPWGAAVGAGVGALIGLSSITGEVKDMTKGLSKATADYTATLDANTGAVTRETKALVYKSLMGNKATASALATAKAAGVSTRDVVSATMGNVAAQGRLDDALAALDRRYNRLVANGKRVPDSLEKTRAALQHVADASAERRGTLAQDIQMARDQALATMSWGEALKGLPKEVRSKLKAEDYDLTMRQVKNLAREYELVPDQKRTLFKAFGIADGVQDLAQMRALWVSLPGAIKNAGIGNATAGVKASVAEIGGNLATLKRDFSTTDLKVFIQATGSDTTVKEVRKATAAFRTMPTEISTQIYALGANATRADIRRVAKDAGVTDKKLIRLMFQSIGVKPTEDDLKSVQRGMAMVGDTPAETEPWERSLSKGLKSGKDDAQTLTSNLADLLSGGAIAKARPDLSGWSTALSGALTNGKNTAAAGATGIGSNLKYGFGSGFAGADGLWSGAVRHAVAAAIQAGRSEAAIHSPSRKTAEIGEMMAKGGAKGVKAHAPKWVEAARDMVSDVMDAFRSGEKDARRILHRIAKLARKSLGGDAQHDLLAMVKRDNQRLEGLYGQRDRVAKKLEAANARLANLRQVKADFISNTFTGMNQQANVLNAGNTAATIASSLQAQVVKVKEFAGLIKRLKRMGYSNAVVAQVAEAGVEGGLAAARALAAASSTEMASINDSYATIRSTAQAAASALGSSMYDAGIEAAAGVVEGLKKRQKAIQQTIMAMAEAMAEAIRDLVKRNTPKPGKGKGDDKGPKAPRMAVGDTSGRRGPDAGPVALSGGLMGGSVHFHFKTYNPVAEPQSRTTNKALDRVANLGLV